MAIEVTLDKAASILAPAIENNINTLLVGPPGVGKTDTYHQVAKSIKHELMVMHPVVSDPTDFKGFPFRAENNGHAEFLPYGELHQMMTAKKPTLVLFDDVGQAPPAVQAALMQLLLKREVNGKPISPKVKFAAATNRRQDRAGVSGVLEPVKSRFGIILHVCTDVDAWVDWALNNGIRPEVVALIRQRPELLHKWSPTAEIENQPCPRTWTAASRILDLGLSDDLLLPALAGAVGEGAAIEVTGFLRCFGEVPDIGEILMTPEQANVPEHPSALYAVAALLAASLDEKTFGQALPYIERLPEEYGVLAVRDTLRRCPKLPRSPDWVAFLRSDLGKLATGQG